MSESNFNILNEDNSLKIQNIDQCTDYLQFINLFAIKKPKELLDTVLQPYIECSSPNSQDISNKDCCDKIENASFSRIEWLNVLHGDDLLEFLYVPNLIQGVCHPAICSAEDLEQNKEFLLEIARVSNLDIVINGGLQDIKIPQMAGNSTNSTQNFKMFEDDFIPFKVQSAEKNRNVTDHVVLFVFFILLITFPLGMYVTKIFNDFQKSKKIHKSQQSKENQKTLDIIFEAFDFKSHIQKFIPSDKTMRKGPLDIFNFLRIVGVCLVVLIHQFQNQQLASNYHEVAEESHRPFILLIYFSFEAVDMFLFMGGFFQAISMVAGKKLEKMGQGKFFGILNIFKSLFFRFLRVWPVLLVNILIFTQFYYYLGTGPIWNMQEGELESCDEFMFSNLLFIDNLSSEYTWKCFGHSWYLSVDFQLYAFCTFVIFIASKNKNIGKLMLWTTLICCFVNNAYFLISNEILALDVADIAKFEQFTEESTYYEVGMNFYRKPWARAPIFIMGLLFGFSYVEKSFLFSNNFFEKCLKKSCMEYFFLFISLVIISFLVYFPIPLLDNRHAYSTIIQSLYFLLLPILTMIAIMILISVSIFIYTKEDSNNKSFVKFVSSKFIAVFAKISFMMYLTHILIIRYRIFSAQNLIPWTVETMLVQYLINLVISCLFASVLHIYIEVPVGALISLLQKRLETQSKPKQLEKKIEFELEKQKEELNPQAKIDEKNDRKVKVEILNENCNNNKVDQQQQKQISILKKIKISSGKLICSFILIFVLILVFIGNVDKIVCFPNCQDCTGELYNECTECVSPFVYHAHTNSCIYPEIYEKASNQIILNKVSLQQQQNKKRNLQKGEDLLFCDSNGQIPQFYVKKGSFVQRWVVVFSSELTWGSDQDSLPEILPEQKGFFNFQEENNPDFYEFNYLVILDCFQNNNQESKNMLIEQIFIQLGEEEYRMHLARNVYLTSIDKQGQQLAIEFGQNNVIQNIFKQKLEQQPEVQLILEGVNLEKQNLEKINNINMPTFIIAQQGQLSEYEIICDKSQNSDKSNHVLSEIKSLGYKQGNFVWNPACYFDDYLLTQETFNSYRIGNKKMANYLQKWANYKNNYENNEFIQAHEPQYNLGSSNCDLFEEIQENMVCQNFQYSRPRTDFPADFQDEEEIYNKKTWKETKDYFLKDDMGAKCANGQEPSVHFKQGVKKQRWILHMKGNSWANEWEGQTYQEQLDYRYERAQKYTEDPSTYYAQNLERSPFEDYNRGYIVYCDPGSMRQGSRTEPYIDDKDRKIWFRGQNNTIAQFNTLLTDFDLANSKEIVIIGASSGGPSAVAYANILQEMVHAVNPYVKIKLIVDGGLFLDVEDQRDNYSFRNGMLQGFYQQSNEETNPPNKECVQDQKKGEEWKCLFAQYSLKYVKSDIQIMILNSGYDFSQVNKVKKEYCWGFTYDEGGDKTQFWDVGVCSKQSMRTIEEYRTQLYKVIQGLKKEIPSLSAWVPSCAAHDFVSFSYNKDFQVPQKSGNSLYGVLVDFLGNDEVFYQLDDVSYPNNKSCVNQAP